MCDQIEGSTPLLHDVAHAYQTGLVCVCVYVSLECVTVLAETTLRTPSVIGS